MSEPRKDDQSLKELRKLLEQIQDMLERTRQKIEDVEKRLESGKDPKPPSDTH